MMCNPGHPSYSMPIGAHWLSCPSAGIRKDGRMKFTADNKEIAVGSPEELAEFLRANDGKYEFFCIENEDTREMLTAMFVDETHRGSLYGFSYSQFEGKKEFSGSPKEGDHAGLEWVIEHFVLFFKGSEDWKDHFEWSDISERSPRIWLFVLLAGTIVAAIVFGRLGN